MKTLVKTFIVKLLFAAIVIHYGCKTEAIKPSIQNFSKLELDTIWTNSINDYSITPKINSDGNLMVSNTFKYPEGEKFKLLNATDGKTIWEWSNFFEKERGFRNENHLYFNNQIILRSRNNTYSFNINSGKTNWKKSSPLTGLVGLSNDADGNIYQALIDGFNQSYIYKTKYDQGNWDLLCTYKDSFPVDRLIITTTTISNNLVGEKLLIYSIIMFYEENGENKGLSKLIAFNITQNKFEWIKDYTNKYIEFMTSAPIATDKQVYYFARYGSNHFLVCINSNDGSVKWERAIPYLGTDKFLYKNSIVVMSLGAQPVLSINKETGDLIWQRDFTEQEKQNINFDFGDGVVFKNYLFSTECDNLLVLNLDNGNIVYNKKISLPNGCLQYGVAIDEARRVFYVQDRYRIICYKLPKEIVY